MSIQIHGAGYSPAVQTAQSMQAARNVQQDAAATENAEAKSEQRQVDAFEFNGDKASYEMDAETVQRMKADLAQTQSRFLDSVRDMLTKQGVKVAEGEGIWKQIAEGKFKADPETVANAQKETAEDGYWGVKQTSERFLKYAKALTGGDPAKAEAMREAFKKGYEEAEKAWGGELPELTKQTYDATMKLFDEWAGEGE